MSTPFTRKVQQRAPFTAGDPAAGYYNDLSIVAAGYGTPWMARSWLDLFTARRHHANPVSIVQLGIGAWQLAHTPGTEDADAWRAVAYAVGEWVVDDLDEHAGLAYQFDMPHTFAVTAPWYSALAQGQALSLLVRLMPTADQPMPAGTMLTAEMLAVARDRVARTLLDDRLGLVVETSHGPALEEYPTAQPSHVLNGWIFALFGLFDLAVSPTAVASEAEISDEPSEHPPLELQRQAGLAFDAGLASLAAMLPAYEMASGWTRYDLYPRQMSHVASPFYHALHIELLGVLAELAASRDRQEATAYWMHLDRWSAALASRGARTSALARKVAFRIMHPRRQVAAS